jgi:carbohydrate-binding DOMON domain-containing protein
VPSHSLGCSTDLNIRKTGSGSSSVHRWLDGGVGNAVAVVVIYMVVDFLGQNHHSAMFTATQ